MSNESLTLQKVMSELKSFGDPQTKKTLMRHGAREPLYGVKVQDLKTILKKTKTNHELSLELYATGNSDAMYLAGLMADETKITKDQLEQWVKQAYWAYLNEYAVPWVASETAFGVELGLQWITSNDEHIAAAGWSTLASCVAVRSDETLDISAFGNLLDQVEKEIHTAPNRVKYTMNGFIISVGSYIKALTEKSREVADRIGPVTVDMEGTACKVPFATEYIDKVAAKGKVGVKRKSARC